MAWLYENREEFRNAVNYTAQKIGYQAAIVEKDYYVTLILKGLEERLPSGPVYQGKECQYLPFSTAGGDVQEILKEIVKNAVYKSDYENVTTRILKERIAYDEIIKVIAKIIASGAFEERE